MISTELLSEVLYTFQEIHYVEKLDFRTIKFGGISIEGNFINSSMNIYELAHKCKEWANNKGFHLWSMQNECQLETFEASHNLDIEHFMADTEIEAVFKACEWILKDKR